MEEGCIAPLVLSIYESICIHSISLDMYQFLDDEGIRYLFLGEVENVLSATVHCNILVMHEDCTVMLRLST